MNGYQMRARRAEGDGGGDGGTEGGEGGGATGPKWLENLPEKYQTDATLRRFQSQEALLDSFLETRKAYRKGEVVVPGEGADEERLKAYRAAMGIPEEATGYDLPFAPDQQHARPDQLDDGKRREQLQAQQQLAHDMGLTQDQAKKLVAWIHQQDASRATEQQNLRQSTVEQAENTLRQVYGDNLNGLLNAVPALYDIILPKEEDGRDRLQEFFDTENHPGGVGKSLVMRQILFNMVKHTNPGRFVAGNDNPRATTAAPDGKTPMFKYQGRGKPMGVEYR